MSMSRQLKPDIIRYECGVIHIWFELSGFQFVLFLQCLETLGGIDYTLTRFQMPVMDGYESCRAIREVEKNTSCKTPIVALTANAMASDERKCLNAGMDAFLTKPIDQEYMVQIILRAVTPSQYTGNGVE